MERYTLQYVKIKYLTTRAAIEAHKRLFKRNPFVRDNRVMYCKLLTPIEAEAEIKDKDRRVILGLVGCLALYVVLVVLWLLAFGGVLQLSTISKFLL